MRQAAPPRPVPPFTAEHDELREEIRTFVADELRPHAAEWEEARWFPDEVFARMGERGLLGIKYPVEYGGRGLGYVEDAVLAQELSRCGSGGLAAGIGAHVSIATPPLWKFGSDEQKERFLAPAIRGERIGALGITEPGAGSDVAGIRTRAQAVDGGYVVNGSKTFITNGVRADFVVTAVKTTEEGGHHGISFLVIERDMDGFLVSKKLEKLGWHASDTAELVVRRRVRTRGEPPRRGEPGLPARDGQLPVGAARDGPRRGRLDGGRAGARGRGRGGPDRAPSHGGGAGGQARGLALHSRTTPSTCSPAATTRSVR